MLSEKRKAYLKKWLTRRLEELVEKSLKSFRRIRDFTDKLPDPIDQASIDSEENVALWFKEREEKLIREIEKALGRYEKGTFGICEECGQDISGGMLMERPIATLCIECKNEYEVEGTVKAYN